jgi:hypothetical protein
MGIPQNPRGTGRAGSKDRGIDHLGDPQDQRHRPRAATEGADMVAVPAFSGRGDPGLRLLHRRPTGWHPGLCPGRDRARGPAHPYPRTDAASHRGVDCPAGPQPDHGPRRANAPGQVHDPRPRLELHRRIRRGARRRRDPDRALQRPDAPHERHRRTLDGGCRHELLDRTLACNQAHLRRILREYETHNQHRRTDP